MAEPFPYTTMVELVHYWSTHDAQRPAFICVDKYRNRFELTRQRLYELGSRWAAVLQGEGVGRKERVVSTLPNGPERVLCDVGIVMAGAVMVNAQCQLTDGSDFLHVLRQSEACAVCVNPDLDFGPWHVLKQHVQHDPLTNTVSSHSLPDLRKVFFIRRTAPLCQDAVPASESSTEDAEARWKKVEKESFLKRGFSSPQTGDFVIGLQPLDIFYKAEVGADDTVAVFTTSGSTGFSKLVPHTHRNFLECYQFIKRENLDQFFITFNCSLLGWVGGYTFMYLALGKGRLLLDMWYGAPDELTAFVWDILVEERCHDGVIQPYLLQKILALKSRKAWMMKNILLAGEPMKKEFVHQTLQLSEAITVSYASSELIIVTGMIVTDVSYYQDFQVGKPPPGNTVKICDSDGHEVPRGTKGQIYAKTQYMTQAYLNNLEDTAASFTPDGFLKTGDIGVMLEDGSLLVEGREPDVIHRGNYIFYPGWLESRIMDCCRGLREVLVVGVPDAVMGTEICACFVPSDPSITEEGVRSLVEEDILTQLEDPLSPRPRYYLSFQDFPTTYTGKPLRKDVRRQAAQRLNLA